MYAVRHRTMLLLIGLSGYAIFSALVTLAGRETGQGSAAGVVNMAQGIGFIIVPAIFGIVMDYSGVRTVFIITAVVALAAAPFLLSAGRNPLSPLPSNTPVPTGK